MYITPHNFTFKGIWNFLDKYKETIFFYTTLSVTAFTLVNWLLDTILSPASMYTYYNQNFFDNIQTSFSILVLRLSIISIIKAVLIVFLPYSQEQKSWTKALKLIFFNIILDAVSLFVFHITINHLCISTSLSVKYLGYALYLLAVVLLVLINYLKDIIYYTHNLSFIESCYKAAQLLNIRVVKFFAFQYIITLFIGLIFSAILMPLVIGAYMLEIKSLLPLLDYFTNFMKANSSVTHLPLTLFINLSVYKQLQGENTESFSNDNLA